MDKRVTPPKRVTSPTWGTPPPCKQALTRFITGSKGDVFVFRTSKPVENLWKNGLFWSRYSFVTHCIDRKTRDWGLAYGSPGEHIVIRFLFFTFPFLFSTFWFSLLHFAFRLRFRFLFFLLFHFCFLLFYFYRYISFYCSFYLGYHRQQSCTPPDGHLDPPYWSSSKA